MSILFKFLIAWGVGAVLMLALSFTIYRQSYYYKKAKAESLGVAERPGILSRLVTVAILFAMILFLTLVDLWVASPERYAFGSLLVFNLALVTLLSLFDAVFIDYVLLVVWRPPMLRLTEGLPTRDAMSRHIKLQFTVGWVFKVPIALLAAGLASLITRGR